MPHLNVFKLLAQRLVPDETTKWEDAKKDLIKFKENLKDLTIDACYTASNSKPDNAEPIGTSKYNASPHLDNDKNNDVNLQITQVVQHYFDFTIASDHVSSKVTPSLLYEVVTARTVKVLA